jgi:DNA-directed RNA polymerase specialized sigma subunit
VPSHVRTAKNKLLRFIRDNNLSLKEVNSDILKKIEITEKMLTCISAALASQQVHSLEEFVYDNSHETIENTIVDSKETNENSFDANILIQAAKKVLQSMSPKERNLILLRYNIIQDINQEPNE